MHAGMAMGTLDLMPGVTLLGQTNGWSWGAQRLATVRLGENDRDYRLGLPHGE
jgi:hypothetical protein